MGKNRLGLHLAAILAIAFFAFLAISSASSTPAARDTDETVLSNKTTSAGLVYDMPSPSGKRFESLGLVFATSVTKFDENGLEVSSQEGIVTMLLKEAQKLGADDILNLRIDENVAYVQVTQSGVGAVLNTAMNATSTVRQAPPATKNVTYTGSALAIKYRD